MIKLNEQETNWTAEMTLNDFLEANDLPPRLCMVRLNGAIITPEAFTGTVLQDGDEVEAIRFLNGG